MKKLLYILFILLWAGVAGAATYRITQSGAGGETGADCANAHSIVWADANVAVGDTLYLCDTETFTTAFSPAASPSSEGERITVQNETGDSPTFNGLTNAILLTTPYWTIDGIHFDGGNKNVAGNSYADYVEVKNCRFYGDAEGYGGHIQTLGSDWYIHDNTFEKMQTATDGNERPQVAFGNDVQTAGSGYGLDSDRQLVIDNVFQDGGGHGKLESAHSEYCVIKGNTFVNTGAWDYNTDGTYATCDSDILWLKGSHYPLFEGNTLYEVGDAFGDYQTGLFHIHNTDNVIIRYNVSYDHDCTVADTYWSTTWDNEPDHTWVYHNTFYNLSNMCRPDRDLADNPDAQGVFAYWGGASDDTKFVDDFHVLNNILSVGGDGVAADSGETPILVKHANSYGDYQSRNGSFHHNITHDISGTFYWWKGSLTDLSDEPQTLDTSVAFNNNKSYDPLMVAPASQNFILGFNSPAIDAAAELTLTNGTGSSSSALIVDDAAPFFTTGSPYNLYSTWVTASGLEDDTIYVNATVPFSVKISAINYSTDTLTLASPQTWQNGVEVYHCPDGVCFTGSAPDIGAFEVEEVGSPPLIDYGSTGWR